MKLLCSWYNSQRFHVRWGKSLSDGFSVSNGVRQGGILSPFLFNVYTDELSSHLVRSGYGCHYLGSVNHLYYADDMVLLSPTPFGLQKLLDVCADYALDHDMVFNTKKTVCMAILPGTSVTLLLLRSRCVVTHSPMLMIINILAIVLPTPIPELMILKFATNIEHYAVGPTHSVANSLYARTLLTRA